MIIRDCSVEGIRIRLQHHRAGRNGILLIHGNSSSKEVFAKQLEKLMKTGLGVVVPDLPGHGGSDDSKRPYSTYSFPGYAGILGSLMRQIGYRSYHVLGWSLGGHIGIEMLARDPAVRSLLITGTPPVRLNPVGVAAGFRWTGVTALAGRKHFRPEDVRRYTSAMMGIRLPDDHQFFRIARRTDGNARLWMVANGMAGCGVDQVEAVSTSDRPIAVVQGAHDPFLRIDYLGRVPYRNLWHGRPVMLDGGHAAHWQSPKAFNEAMMDFITTH
ncbi:alpha/beta fold hydrolase [Bradyrhizobium brasilense]|uniref:Alpha/beta hydrolase n=1 Tax=Bradyrhizobium brasilense TaxID=1419277 RepID=A0ABY8JFU6_9BRAD|nr:alpha/beta hydrolase [Bradyrhizobium brasilense]WFU62667.1 alpha/beta hydrolase [Bradyrhizobium brasilense]